jgi:hypothetical protein
MTVKYRPPSQICTSGLAVLMPRCSAVAAPSTTAGYVAVAAFSQVPEATVAPTVRSRPVRTA